MLCGGNKCALEEKGDCHVGHCPPRNDMIEHRAKRLPRRALPSCNDAGVTPVL